jgi:membrane protein DedA with SNARE-associated domain
VATDCIIYGVGRHLRQQTQRGGWLRRAVRPGHLRVATRWFAKYGNWIIFIARLTPGTRLIVFISAGVRGVPLPRFVFYDGLASLIYVPVTLYVGEQLGARIGDLGQALAWLGSHVQWLFVAVIIGLGVRHWWRRRLQMVP